MLTLCKLSSIFPFFAKKKMFHTFSLNLKRPQEKHAEPLEMLFASPSQRIRDQLSTIRSEELKSNAKDSLLTTNEKCVSLNKLIHFILHKLRNHSYLFTSSQEQLALLQSLSILIYYNLTRIYQLVFLFFQVRLIEEMFINTSQTLARHRSTTLPNANKLSVLPKEFSIPQRIGSGLTAEVYRCKHTQFGTVCVKLIHNSFAKSSLGEKLINNQVRILQKLQHQNVLKFHSHFKYNDRRVIVTQLCQGGDMQKQIKSRKKYNEREALQIFSEIIEGCKYLLQNDIIHRDLKPANILFKSKNGQAKLADFGFAVKNSDTELMKKNVGSPLYMAPQALSDLKYTQKSQVFSLGILIYQMLSGKTPWNAVSQRDLLSKMKTTRPAKIMGVSQKIWQNIILKCLQIESSKRITLKDLTKAVKQVSSELNGDYGKIVTNNNYQTTSYEQYLSGSQQLYKQLSKYQKNSLITILPKIPNKTKDKKSVTLITDRPLKKQSNSVRARQKVRSSTKKSQRVISTASQDQKVQKRHLSSAQILRKINPRSYSFLPESLMMKFEYIIQKYDYLIRLQESNYKKGQKHQYRPKPHSQIQKDLMITEVSRCNDEKELCQIILGFVRRLLRLAKNYLNLNQKNYPEYLDLFYKRVTEIAQ